MLNVLDLSLAVLIIICAFWGYKRGLIHMVFRLFSFVLALILAYMLYPHLSRFIRESGLFYTLRDSIGRTMGFNGSHDGREGMIQELPLPGPLRNLIDANNTPEMFNTLRATSLEEYVSGFIANMVIGVIVLIVVFLLASLIIALISRALDIVARLPLINFLNRTGGFVAGVGIGIFLAWLCIAVMIVIVSTTANLAVYELLRDSVGMRFFLDRRWMLPILTIG